MAGSLSAADLAAAGTANRTVPDEPRLLDAVVRDAIYAQKALARGRRWDAVAAVERMRRSLTELRGRRDGLRLDPADPAGALATVLGEVQAGYDLGAARRALLEGRTGRARGLPAEATGGAERGDDPGPFGPFSQQDVQQDPGLDRIEEPGADQAAGE